MTSASMEMSGSASSRKESARKDLDDAVSALRDRARPFARLAPRARADLLRACIPRIVEVAPRWAAAAIEAKGLAAGTPASSEE
jgi:acyl-CoA reductase-like NAD-dependent aldehyde dehydrogenase